MSAIAPTVRPFLARRLAASFVSLLPIFLIVSGTGCLLVLASMVNAKWFVMVFLSVMALFAALLFKDLRLYGVWLLAASIPVVFQYRILQQGKHAFETIEHFGGALAEPVISFVDFPIALLFVCWLAQIALSRNARLPKWTRFDTLVVVYLLLSCLSLFNTTEYALFVAEMCRYLKYLILYWCLRTFLGGNLYLGGILAVSLLVLPIQALVSFLQYFLMFTLPIPVGGVSVSSFELVNGLLIQRVTGLVGHCNTFAHYLLVPLCFALVLLFARIPLLVKALIVPFFLCGVMCLVLTFSRNGWLAFSLCCVLIPAIALYRGRFKIMYAGALVLAGLFVLGVIVSTDLLEIILARVLEDSGNAYDSRWDLMQTALGMIYDYPVFGIGLNSFEENMAIYDTTGVINIIQRPVHNIFLLVASETGIPTMLVFMIMGGVLVRYAWKILKRSSESDFIVGAIGLSTLFALSFTNLFDLSLRHESLMGMSTLLAAIIVSHYTRPKGGETTGDETA